jgi:MbtH protein
MSNYWERMSDRPFGGVRGRVGTAPYSDLHSQPVRLWSFLRVHFLNLRRVRSHPMFDEEKEYAVDDNATYQVLVNDEEQHSLWPEGKELPDGWRSAGKRGSKQDCMDHVDAVWTDMRPRSLRERMAADPQV